MPKLNIKQRQRNKRVVYVNPTQCGPPKHTIDHPSLQWTTEQHPNSLFYHIPLHAIEIFEGWRS